MLRIAIWWGLLCSMGWIWWLGVPSSTDKKHVQPRGLGFVRWYRWLWARPVLWMLCWPHVIVAALGLNRVAVPRTPGTVVWSDGQVRIVRFGRGANGPPVLLVHALVSSATILDLSPQRSLIASLADAGHDVFLLDWGSPGPDDADADFDAGVAMLMEAEQRVLTLAGASTLQMIGYCTGATLALARLGAFPHPQVASFVALAAPVDLSVPCGMRTLLTSKYFKPVLALDHNGCVPGSLIREAFHALRPSALRDAIGLIKMRAARREFAPIAQWSWDMPAMPGALFFDMVALFRTNALWAGSLRVLDRPVDLASIRTPILLAVAARDHICPSGSSLVLAAVPGPKVEVLTSPSGHVSMITGTHGREILWPRLNSWLTEHRPPARKTPRRRSRAKVAAASV